MYGGVRVRDDVTNLVVESPASSCRRNQQSPVTTLTSVRRRSADSMPAMVSLTNTRARASAREGYLSPGLVGDRVATARLRDDEIALAHEQLLEALRVAQTARERLGVDVAQRGAAHRALGATELLLVGRAFGRVVQGRRHGGGLVGALRRAGALVGVGRRGRVRSRVRRQLGALGELGVGQSSHACARRDDRRRGRGRRRSCEVGLGRVRGVDDVVRGGVRRARRR